MFFILFIGVEVADLAINRHLLYIVDQGINRDGKRHLRKSWERYATPNTDRSSVSGPGVIEKEIQTSVRRLKFQSKIKIG